MCLVALGALNLIEGIIQLEIENQGIESWRNGQNDLVINFLPASPRPIIYLFQCFHNVFTSCTIVIERKNDFVGYEIRALRNAY